MHSNIWYNGGSHVIPENLEKSGTAGLVPIRKTVHDRGRTYQRTYWTKPKDMHSFHATAPAVEFLLKSIESQQELANMVKQLEQYNTGLAAEIYNEMEKAGQTAIQVADKIVEVNDWMDKRETNPTSLIAGLRDAIAKKGSIKMGDLAEVWSDISYQYRNFGLSVSQMDDQGKVTPIKKVSIAQSLIPIDWANKVDGVAKTLRQVIKDGLGMLRLMYNKRGKPDIPLMLEEADLRRKENRDVMTQVEEIYSEKQTSRAGALTQSAKVATDGVAAKQPGAGAPTATLRVVPKTFTTLDEEGKQDMYAQYKIRGGKLSYINFKHMMYQKDKPTTSASVVEPLAVGDRVKVKPFSDMGTVIGLRQMGRVLVKFDGGGNAIIVDAEDARKEA
jgi:hypothetical protein